MKSSRIHVALVAALLLAPLPAAGQIAKTPEAEARLKALGARWDREVLTETFKVYAPLLKEMPRHGVKETRDIAYGSDERHRLDLYVPAAKPAAPAPVVIAVHGGGFTGGDKTSPDRTYLDNVGTYFARHGMIGVAVTYRLAPKHPWPAGAQDLAGAVKWARANAAQHGGDPNRLYLLGTSAGAVHVAAYTFQEEFQVPGGDGVAGAILMSGLYKVLGDDDRMKAYYGTDAAKHAAMAPIAHIAGRKIPVFIMVAEFDPYWIQNESVELFAALCARDKHCPRMTRLVGHNHLSVTTSINTPDDSVGADVLDFIKSTR